MSEEKKAVTFDNLESCEDLKYDEVEIPEWGGTVYLGSLNAGIVLAFVEANENPSLKRIASLRLVADSMLDGPKGNRLVTDDQSRDRAINVLMGRNMAIVNKVAEAVIKLNGLDKKVALETKNESSEAETGSSASPSVLH